MLFQNDQGGKVARRHLRAHVQGEGHRVPPRLLRARHQGLLGRPRQDRGRKPDFLFPSYADSYLYDIVRQATETGQLTKFFLVRGSLGPGLKNKDGIDEYMVYVPKYFEEAEKTDPKVAKFVKAYKDFYKRDFPYDQAPLCSASCYDHVYMLVEAMKKAGTVDDPAAVKKALMSMTVRRHVEDPL